MPKTSETHTHAIIANTILALSNYNVSGIVVPKQVTGLQYTLNENNSSSYQALLTWPPAKNETSVVTYYEMLSWANDERSPAVVKLYQESTTIGLSSEDVYRVTVRAGSPLGMGDWSVLLRIGEYRYISIQNLA